MTLGGMVMDGDILQKMSKDISSERLSKYWPSFNLTAYGIYDDEKMLLFGHPGYRSANPYTVIEKPSIDADTIIMLEGYPTAIVKYERYPNFESLYSILAHELFHGYQHLQGENRFPNEVLGITYPLSLKNIELRSLERTNLYHAVFCKNNNERKRLIDQFVSIREKRKWIVPDHIEYENLVETVEGPAWYVEMKAYIDKSPLPPYSIIQHYGKNLLNNRESTQYIRKSCYTSGLFMCLLLDHMVTSWKEEFFSSPNSLYEFFKNKLNVTSVDISEVVTTNGVFEEIVDSIRKTKEDDFNKFYHLQGYHLVIEGDMTIVGLDPMNIVNLEDQFLHKNFVKLKIAENEYNIKGPVVTYTKHNMWKPIKAQIRLKAKPVYQEGILIADEIGSILGNFSGNTNIIKI